MNLSASPDYSLTSDCGMKNRNIIVVADPHLGTKPGDIQHFIDFLTTLHPVQARLLFLGDLFHIWAAPVKYHTDKVQSLMKALFGFREKGGEIYLVTGNRDVLFPGKPVGSDEINLPFDLIAPDFLELTTGGGKLVAYHGDTVNSKDKRYLRWRKLIRNPLFQWIFLHLIPARRVKKIMFTLERKLQQTNQAFRKAFPEDEWLNFLESAEQRHHPRLVLAGHFHPQDLIVQKNERLTGLVIPDWGPEKHYLVIKDDLSYQLARFEETNDLRLK